MIYKTIWNFKYYLRKINNLLEMLLLKLLVQKSSIIQDTEDQLIILKILMQYVMNLIILVS